MKKVSLSGSKRENVGKKDTKAIRNSGRVPAVVYGSGKQTHFSVKHTDMEKLVYNKDVFNVNLDIEGDSFSTIIQDIQFHPVTDRILHVDFLELDDNKKVKVEIPVVLEGRSEGVMMGGRLQQVFRKLTVFAYPKDLPEVINVDITNLKIGDSIRVKDLMTEDMQLLNAPNAVVVAIKMARGVVLTAEEEAEAEAAEAAAAEAAEAESASE
ncbi:MAG TPA: 50S ribosomal protein L25/general stress protein Ctc [Crocinitomix sp.]|nr:50S ribosomal protein L25/general stress protein Ctc [Crocinitomix sp.]